MSEEFNKNKQICFVILPGFAVSSMPVAPVENYIRSQGYQVFSANFWGDFEIRNFSELSVDDCIAGIHKLIQRVKSQTNSKIIGLGISLGGALYLEYAKKYNDLDYIVSIGTPFKLKNRKWISLGLVIVPLVKYLNAEWAIIDSAKMVVDFFEQRFLQNLQNIKTPVLFLHSKKDNITYFSALLEYMPKLSSAHTHLFTFEDKDHVINYDAEAILQSISQSIDLIKKEV